MGDVWLTNSVVTDDKLGVIGAVALLAPASSTNLTITTNITMDVTNVADVVGQPAFTNGVPIPDIPVVVATNDAVVDVVAPGYTLTKILVAPTNRPPIPGETLTFMVTVANTGDVTLVEVPLTDIFDTNTLTYVSALPAPGSVSGNTLTWPDLGPLPSGNSTNVEITFAAVGFTSPGLETNVVMAAPLTPTNHPPVLPQTNGAPYRIDAPASLSGSVFDDLNANGIEEAGDTNGIAGSTIVLVDGGGSIVGAVVTDGTGAYVFTNLPPGNYIVIETNAANFVSTGDHVGANDDQIPVALASGEASSGNDFLDTVLVSIGDTVWTDTNGNGAQDSGEPGVSNVTVTLYGVASNVVATTLTDVSGVYVFSNLLPGAYAVGFMPPSGYGITLRNATNDVALDSNPSRTTGITDPVTLTSGQADMTVDAGIYLPAVIGGRMWWDLDTNGVINVTEQSMTNILVTLRDVTNGVVATTLTGTNGTYVFTNLLPGTYTVVFPQTNGWYFSPTNGTNDVSLDSDADPVTGVTAPVTVLSGETNLTLNAGVFVLGELGQTVWVDVDKDGIPDEDLYKYGLNGVRVSLFRIIGATTNFYGTTLTTNQVVGVTTNNGYFNFTNLPFGLYLVTVSNGIPANLTIKTTPPRYLISVGYQSIILNANFGYMFPPLPITLKSFSASHDGEGVRIAWETGVEVDNLGFNIYRSDAPDGARVKINGGMIIGMGNSQGQRYELRDAVPDSRVNWYYWLEDVSFKMETVVHGPAVLSAIGADNKGVIGYLAVSTSGLCRISYAVMQAAGLPVETLDPVQLKVQMGGVDIASYVSAAGPGLVEGDFVLFYAPVAGTNQEYTVAIGTNAMRMGLVYARPSRAPGEVWAGIAEEGKTLDFAVSTNYVRYLLMDFLETPVWVMDVTDPKQAKMLYGYSTLQPGTNGLTGVYLSYPGIPSAACKAVGAEAVHEISVIKASP
jgi:hypothetical protein